MHVMGIKREKEIKKRTGEKEKERKSESERERVRVRDNNLLLYN